ncbi:ribonuclease Y [Candidatus Berkelbacteria bacterium CG08_land_8_20_14_0_20_39_8]|uniref:Ribonuclease Y n=1 Tax=Candidatus Berkelbacteria bacterium CG08_land_8_20_14_0_20_39_8 TaxID=1974511 RepID=A0A2M6YCL7_9BACT|nr:MAG: ribonuclease Y [Candidatus Berkelbacteria bacterium CG08_land_8_20_14_0_20_39_8]
MLSIIAIAAFIVGGGVGFLVFRLLTSKKIDSAKNRADKIIADAKVEGKEFLVSAKDEALKYKEEIKKELAPKEKEIAEIERSLRNRELGIDKKFDQLEAERKALSKRSDDVEQLKQTLRDLRTKQEESLERIAKMNKNEAKDVLLGLVEKEGKEDLVKKIKEVNLFVKESADQKAREVIVSAIQRLAPEFTAETTISSVAIPSDDMKGRIIGREGRNIQSFEKVTGVDLIIDDTPEMVVLSSFDPLRRALAKVTLEKLIADGRVNPTRIEEMYEKAKKEVAEDIRRAGEEAAYEVGIAGLPPEIIKVLGRLKYRTSYGQNQLMHSVEVAGLSGLLAEELGADVRIAKTAGLLHDLGKAVDQDVPGNHAVISADIARKYKIDPAIIHAIEAHHEDVEIKTVEAAIVQAADAISSARPGARRESLETYIKRLKDLENIANTFEGVGKSFAIQAGREVRVIVIPEEIDDLASEKLSKEIAKKIETDMQYPGQIKVNVIREVRATEYAK